MLILTSYFPPSFNSISFTKADRPATGAAREWGSAKGEDLEVRPMYRIREVDGHDDDIAEVIEWADPATSGVGTFQTCRHVRSSVAIGGIADISRTAHFGSD
jgi:hypothetical protein